MATGCAQVPLNRLLSQNAWFLGLVFPLQERGAFKAVPI